MSEDVFKLKRGDTGSVNAYLPALGEPVYDYQAKKLRIGDGVTLGGTPLSLEPSPDLTGTPTTPTAPLDTNTTQIASTAFVVGQAGTSTPLVDGTGTVGISLRYSRQDHVHPIDTSRAPLASPAFTGVPTASTAAPGTNTTQLATTAFVKAADDLKANLASPAFTGVPTGPTPAVGTNTTQLATTAMVQAEIANKRAFTTYTPVVTAASGTFTSASATGGYMVAFGICYFIVTITITTKGTGAQPIFTLPRAALSGSSGWVFPCRENAVTGKAGMAVIQPGLTTAFTSGTDTGVPDLSTNGAVIVVSGSYPIA